MGPQTGSMVRRIYPGDLVVVGALGSGRMLGPAACRPVLERRVGGLLGAPMGVGRVSVPFNANPKRWM
jgi:hypothetical protein